MASSLREHWTLDPAVSFLNHGSFGACPRVVLEAQARYRAQMEAQPVRFMQRELEPMLDAARAELAAFLNTTPQNLVFVPNATSGVNAVVSSLALKPGDELLTTNQDYNACRNALLHAAQKSGANVVVAPVPFPVASEDVILEAILAAVTERTRFAMIDHVTSPTALLLPIERIVRALESRGVTVLVDGAHAPGAVPLELDGLRPHFYTGNLHKWVCAPKGAAFLWARPDQQETLHPAVVSHGQNVRRPGRSAFHDRFDWTGTSDPTAHLCVPDALQFGAKLHPGGWEEWRARNHDLALAGRSRLAEKLGVPLPSPDGFVATMATVPLHDALQRRPASSERFDPLQTELYGRTKIEVPIIRWGEPVRRWVRISAQAYNHIDEYDALAEALLQL